MKLFEKVRNACYDRTFRSIMIYTFFCGLVAHGVMFFNKFSWHDDLQHGFELSVGAASRLGRWFRAFLGYVVNKTFGGGQNPSLPWLHGLLSLLFIALSAYTIIKLLDISESINRFLICGLMVAFPVITSTFAYMFTAPYYFLALFLATLSVYVATKLRNVWGLLLSSLCISCCLGIYQPYFSVALSLFVILIIFRILHNEYTSMGQIFKQGFYYISICVAGVIEYYATWKIVLHILGEKPSQYQGLDTLGTSGISSILHGIPRAYKAFFLSYENDYENVYLMRLSWFQKAVIISTILMALYLIIHHFRKNKGQSILMALLIALLPLCYNIIYVICAFSPDSKIHSLMQYGQTMNYVFFLCGIEYIFHLQKKATDSSEEKKTTQKLQVLRNTIYVTVIFVLSVFLFGMIYFDNNCYLKAEMVQQQTISDLNVMVSRIKGTEGYDDSMPICLVMTGEGDSTLWMDNEYSNITIVPYKGIGIYPYHNSRNVKNYLKHWCGFSPKYVNQKKFQDMGEVQSMPSYPDAGSIKIIKNTVVVRW